MVYYLAFFKMNELSYRTNQNKTKINIYLLIYKFNLIFLNKKVYLAYGFSLM